MIKFKHKGNFDRTKKFLDNATALKVIGILESYGRKGVDALAAATPVDTGETARSWSYKIQNTSRGYKLFWSNSHVDNGAVVAILLQYGHGTGTGGYVEGRDYINPAMRPIFDEIANKIREEVSKL